MLSKQAERVLGIICKNKNSFMTVIELHAVYFDEQIEEPICDKAKYKRLSGAIAHLNKEAYIEIRTFQNWKMNFVWATHKGLRYKEFRLIELKQFFMRSILTPVFISIITAVATTIIIDLLK